MGWGGGGGQVSPRIEYYPFRRIHGCLQPFVRCPAMPLGLPLPECTPCNRIIRLFNQTAMGSTVHLKGI